MIHSMSGGVLQDAGQYTFVKVGFDDGSVFWYISDIELVEGDTVKAPRGASVDVGKVLRVERNVDGHVAPVPIKRAKRIICRV